MGFLDNLFGKPSQAREIEVDYSSLDSWITTEIKESSTKLVSKALPSINDVLKVNSKLRENVQELSSQEHGDMHDRVKGIVKTSKPRYIALMLDLTDSLKVSDEPDYEEILEFRKHYSEMLEGVAKASLSEGKYLPMAYGDTMTAIQKDIKNLIDAGKELNEQLEDASKINTLTNVRDSKTGLMEALKEEKILKEKVKTVKSELSELVKKQEESKIEYDKIVEAESHSSDKNELSTVENERKAIGDKIYQELASIKKLLRKYERIVAYESNLSKEDKESVEFYISKPVETFASRSNVIIVLTGVGKALTEGKIESKNKEKHLKSLERMQEVLSDSRRSEYNTLVERESQLRKEITDSPRVKELKTLKVNLEQLNQKVKEKENELHAIEKKVTELKQSIGETKKGMQDKLKELDVTLSF